MGRDSARLSFDPISAEMCRRSCQTSLLSVWEGLGSRNRTGMEEGPAGALAPVSSRTLSSLSLCSWLRLSIQLELRNALCSTWSAEVALDSSSENGYSGKGFSYLEQLFGLEDWQAVAASNSLKFCSSYPNEFLVTPQKSKTSIGSAVEFV